MTSFSSSTNRINGPSELTNRIRLCILDNCGDESLKCLCWIPEACSAQGWSNFYNDKTFGLRDSEQREAL